MRNATLPQTASKSFAFTGIEYTWESLSLPGAYVDRATGDLYRIPAEALNDGGTVIHRQSNNPSRLVQISSNPHITTNVARNVAAENNIQPNF